MILRVFPPFRLIHLVALGLAFAAALLWADACSWGLDQAVTYRQALHFLETGAYPDFGLLNSQGFRNPNALVLFAAVFLAFFKNPVSISIALYMVQVAVMLWCYHRIIMTFCPDIKAAVYSAGIPLLLWQPGFFYNAIDLWAQSQCRILICILMMLLITASSVKQRKKADFFIGILLAVLPALHLALGVLLPAAGLYLLLLRKRHSLFWLGAGAAVVVAAVWVPWVLFMTAGGHANGSQLHFRKQNAELLRFGMTPFLEIGRLLFSSQDVPLARLGTPAQATNVWLSVIGILRGTTVIIMLVAVIIGVRKASARMTGRLIAWSIGGFMLVFSMLGFAGWAPYSGRTDIGYMFIPGFLLLGTTACAWLFSRAAGSWNLFFMLFTAAQTFLCAFILNTTYNDVFARSTCSAYDIPIKDKVSVAENLVIASRGMTNVNVRYSIKPFYEIYGWVREFQAIDDQKYYKPECIVESYAGVLAPHRLRFDDTSASPDFIIANPKSDHESMELPGPAGVFLYSKIFSNHYLDLWKKTTVPAEKDKVVGL